MKRCCICKETKSFEDFHKQKSNKDGHKTYCKLCQKGLNKTHYNENKLSYHSRTKIRRGNNSIWMEEYKKSLKCELCPESRPGCITFHHLDPNEKEMDVSLMSSRGISQKRILKEIEKCKVLCFNCHMNLHYEEKINGPRLGR